MNPHSLQHQVPLAERCKPQRVALPRLDVALRASSAPLTAPNTLYMNTAASESCAALN
ncbi:hypothetical protein [Limnohabitans sp. T6-5]|uniref:hypothetical protein n=1 Tax=Limnohabitans sp. T6-5 TaxID=1100724 RepID=UPI001304A60E|nr:hypothetical protein [Limnohabitans sp. T6-5]